MKPVPWPEIQELIPPIGAMDREALKQSLKRFGYRGPPVFCLPDGRIIDGHTRVELWDGKCPVEVLDVDEATGRALAIAHNEARRQLSLEEIAGIRQKQRETALKLRTEGKTQQQAAEAVGVTQRAVAYWEEEDTNNRSTSKGCKPDRRIKLSGEDKAEIVRRVKVGDSQAAIAADFHITQQRVSQIVSKAQKQAARQRKSAKHSKQAKCPPVIRLGDGSQFKGECDLLLTDPPYSTDADLTKIVPMVAGHLERVKPTGRALIFVGSYPAELRAYLNMPVPKHLVLEQLLIWTYKNCMGPTAGKLYNVNWQPILHFVGKKAPKLRTDKLNELFAVKEVSAPDGRHGTRYFKWQKPDKLADELIRHTTDPGDMIFDPFAGSGVFLRAAARTQCQSLGYEIDRKTYRIALRQGCVANELQK